jgi:hypothetical protein
MTSEIATYTIRLTKKEREALDLPGVDAVGWRNYYLNHEDDWDEDELNCNDMTAEDSAAEVANAKVAKIEDNSLTLVPGSMLEADIRERLEIEIVGFTLSTPAMCRVIRRLIAKIEKASENGS